MTCKDCIHCDVCFLHKKYSEDDMKFLGYKCDDFINKTSVIELPCEIGDKVYTIFDKKVYEGTVVQTRTFTSSKGVVYAGNAEIDVYDMFYHDGRTYKYNIAFRIFPRGTDHDIYFTREQAEKALKEIK